MKNKLTDLNDHLFAQLERLSDEDLEGDALATELKRSNAIKGVASCIVKNAALALKAQRVLSDGMLERKELPPMLEVVR